MNKSTQQQPTTIDNKDESLMRYYYVTIAANQKVDRRIAEVQFRTDWFAIRRLDDNRQGVFSAIRDMVRKIK